MYKKSLKKFLSAFVAGAAMLALAACGSNTDDGNDPSVNPVGNTGTDGQPVDVVLRDGDTYAVIDVIGAGKITLKLFPEIAPLAVERFKLLADEGYYEGLIFHRVISNFMIQAGSPNGDGVGGSSHPEYVTEPSAKATHRYGAISTANRGEGTNDAQFFIVQNPDGTPHLEGKHTVFGQVIEGFDVVEAVAGVVKDPNDRPEIPLVIRYVKHGIHAGADFVPEEKGNEIEYNHITDRVVAKDDYVNIDFVGSVDGVPFDGGSTGGQGTIVQAGSTNYIDDFLDQIIGIKPGETVDVNVTFPDSYGEASLAGKKALFVTTVNYIVEIQDKYNS